MNNLKTFYKPEFGQVRVMQQDGESWFVAKDVCEVLEIGNSRQALTRLDDDEKADVILNDGSQNRKMNAVNEYGLYNLVLASRKSEAKAFKRWITHEVIPSIRKTGSYINPRNFTKEQIVDIITNPDFMRALYSVLSRYHAIETAREVEKAIHKQIVSELKPAKEYLDKILASDGDMTVSQIAADYGLSAIALNKILEENKVQHKVNGQWLLTKEYMKKGYTHSGTTCIPLAGGENKVVICTQWTQKGRLFIYNLLKKLGYAPVEDEE